ncbi:MAG: RodZ domain-containing protein [Actinomycetota bacterium]
MNQQTIGQRLSGAREAIRASLFQASQDTKIRVDFLQAMENDDFDFVSGGPYVRGMLRSYVRWLGIDEAPILAEFDRLSNARPQPSVTQVISRPPGISGRHRRPQWLIAAVSAAGLLVLLSVIGLLNPGSDVAPPPPDPVGDQSANSPEPGVVVDEGAQVSPDPQEPVFEGVNVGVLALARVWMSVEADGDEQLFVGFLTEDEERTFEAEEVVSMRIGNLGDVEISVNGRDLGSPGQSGQVETIELTPQTTSFGDSDGDSESAEVSASTDDTEGGSDDAGGSTASETPGDI